MAGGIYVFRNFEQEQLKMAWTTNVFILDLVYSSQNVLELYLVFK